MLGTSLVGKGGISSVVRSYRESGIMDRLGIDYYATHRDGSKMEKALFYLSGAIKIIANLHRYRIIHVHTASRWSFRRLLPIILLGKLLKKKVVTHIHGAEFDVYYRDASFIERNIIEKGLRVADRVVVLSVTWRDKILNFCPSEKIMVIPNAVPVSDIELGVFDFRLARKKVILFLGELGQRKGVYDLIRAIQKLASEGHDIDCLLCGNGEIEKVRGEIRRVDLEAIIKVPGWMRPKEKKRLFQQAYVYVLPSYHEGLPMGILEAMSNGIPVISTPVGGIPEVVKDSYNGFLVPPGEPEKLADRIALILGDEDLWKRLSLNALETIKGGFSIEKTEEKLRELYAELS